MVFIAGTSGFDCLCLFEMGPMSCSGWTVVIMLVDAVNKVLVDVVVVVVVDVLVSTINELVVSACILLGGLILEFASALMYASAPGR